MTDDYELEDGVPLHRVESTGLIYGLCTDGTWRPVLVEDVERLPDPESVTGDDD